MVSAALGALSRFARGALQLQPRILPCKSFNRFQFRTLAVMADLKAFTQHEVVKDVIPVAPQKLVKVSYDSGVEVNLGNTLTPTQVKNQPTLKWDSEKDALYTVIMTDPDAPSRQKPEFREWHHWLVANVPGNDISKGDVLAEYVGSGPPPETGLHRYVFLIFKQQGRLEDKEHGHLTNRSADNRGGFKTVNFVTKHKLGNPIAGNFYQAEYDDYVPILYKQLGAA